VAWRALGNTDWRRDLVLSNGAFDHYASADLPRSFIGLDATSKTAEDGHPRGWPEEIFMSDEIIKKVDERWSAYGLQ
jgi:4-hydroxy-3-polyprenylbenzoate decarboxylase